MLILHCYWHGTCCLNNAATTKLGAAIESASIPASSIADAMSRWFGFAKSTSNPTKEATNGDTSLVLVPKMSMGRMGWISVSSLKMACEKNG
jgi:hypothetical protein